MQISDTPSIALPASYTLAGQQPQRVVQPTTIAELATVVGEAARTHTAIVPWGAGSRQWLTNPPTRYDVALDLCRLDRLIEYHPADLVVMVEAGVTLGTVQSHLAAQGQWLPWDPFAPLDATIGGLLATAAWGPLRLGYGGPREWLLGMQVVLGDGRLVQSGGRVVKNVAGYDTHKLHLGAFGTLGVIAMATFKVAPLPEQMASLRVTLPTVTEALHTATALRQPPLQPVALTITVNETVTLTVRFAGVAAAVARQLALAADRCGRHRDVTVQHNDREWWSTPIMPPLDQTLWLRIGVPDHRLTTAVNTTLQIAQPNLTIFPGLGLCYARWPAAAASHLLALRQTLGGIGGYVVVEYGLHGIDRWGPPPPSIDLMHTLRQRWDPAGILNPGRWLIP